MVLLVKIVTGVRISAFTWSTVSRRLLAVSVVTSGARDWAWAVAASGGCCWSNWRG